MFTYLSTIPSSLRAHPWRALSLTDGLLLAPAFLMALAFELYGDRFGKLGFKLSLSEAWGAVPNFVPKLFPMEIFLVWIALLTAWRFRQLQLPRQASFPLCLFGFVLAFGLARMVPDLGLNTILVMRNSAFIWYLFLPLAIALHPVPSLTWNKSFRVFYTLTFTYFLIRLLVNAAGGETQLVHWFVDLGLPLALAYGFCAPSSIWTKLTLVGIGLALAISALNVLQRTILTGVALTFLLLAISHLLRTRWPQPHWLRAGWIASGLLVGLGGVLLATYPATSAITTAGASVERSGAVSVITSPVRATSSDGTARASWATHFKFNPVQKSETNSRGLEKFRYYMWLGAWQKFLSSPLWGIGFERQVVTEAYYGSGKFRANKGGFVLLSDPPIAGPHNSYLNAIARLGIGGFALLALHLCCAWIFLKRRYYSCLFILIGQALYASFNVGLEGPIRSFPLLLLIGVAMKAEVEATYFRPAQQAQS